MIVINKDMADKAIKKVSVSDPEPNFAPISISLTKPKGLLKAENIIIKTAVYLLYS